MTSKEAAISGKRSMGGAESAGGTALTTDRLSGALLMTQGFRGTICRVKARDYLIRKLNDELLPEVAEAEKAEGAIIGSIVGMMRLLTPHDFELLVDLAFSNSGWRRLGIVGRTQKTVDIELLLPTTKERAFVQVKSKTGSVDLKDYVGQFEGMQGYDRMFFIWHSGNVRMDAPPPGVTLIGPEALARMVLDAGLYSWLKAKVS